MEAVFWILAGLCLLLTGAAGAALGFWRGRRRTSGPPPWWPTEQARQLAQLAQSLSGLLHSVAQDVDHHHTQLQQANEGLRSASTELSAGAADSPSAWAALVLRTVAEIVQVNERLQHRLQQAEETLHQQRQQIQNHMTEARTDPLTGLPNRRAFDDELVRRLAEWQRKGALFCLLLVDVDHFKALNDRYGHPAGDQVLRQLAEFLLTVLRDMDLVARIGGEEFAMLLPSTNLPDAMRVAQRVRAAVADARWEIAPHQCISASISLGLTPVQPGDHPLLLLRRADQALYAAKQAGRDCGFYHDGHTCRPIPFCSPPDRPFPRPEDWEPFPDGKLSESEPPFPPTPTSFDDFQTACEALRDRLAALTQPTPPHSPSET